MSEPVTIIPFIHGIEIDVVSKPITKPKSIKAELRVDLAQTGVYFGREFPEYIVPDLLDDLPEGKAKAKQAIKERIERLPMTETAEMYGARLLSEIVDNPQRYFARREVARPEADLIEAARDLWATCEAINLYRSVGFPRNTEACQQYGTCKFFGICSTHEDVYKNTPNGWEIKPRDEKAQRRMSWSRQSTTMLCPRKSEFEYEIGLRRPEKAVPLRFGEWFHHGQEVMGMGHPVSVATAQVIEAYEAMIDDCPTDEGREAFAVEREQLTALLYAYELYWSPFDADVEIIATEADFGPLPIVNPDTGQAHPDFEIVGKRDKIIRRNGRNLIKEYKTTSDAVHDDSSYWERWRMNGQISLYLLGSHLERHFEGVSS